MAKKKNKVQIIEKKLGRSGVVGQCWEYGRIEIDERLMGKERFFTIIHELTHYCFQDATERQVLKAEKIMGNVLWAENYRRVEQ